MASKLATLDSLKKVMGILLKPPRFTRFSEKAQVLTFTPGKLKVELRVEQHMVDESGRLHPSCVFAIFDDFTTLTAMTKYANPPASVAATIHHFAPAKLGNTLRIESEVVTHVGQQLYVEAQFLNVENDELVAKGGQSMAFPKGKGQNFKELK